MSYTLTVGIHRHTITSTSRDVDRPKTFDTREEALADLEAQRRDYACFGYVIWFAELEDPDGNKTTLEQNGDYSR